MFVILVPVTNIFGHSSMLKSGGTIVVFRIVKSAVKNVKPFFG